MAGRLQGRRVIVTGAASGMGRATAQLFAEEGAQVAAIDVNAEGLDGVGAARAAIDITDAVELTQTVEAFAKELGGIDGLVNAAGILRTAPAEETDMATWQRIIDVNLTAPAHLCRLVIPHLRAAGGGTIVNFGSIGGMRGYAGHSAYAASKGGLIALSKALAVDLAPSIRVNALCPGFIGTPMTDALYVDKWSNRDVTLQKLAMKRAGLPEEVARAALFLTSDESSFSTGTAMVVDGGSSWH